MSRPSGGQAHDCGCAVKSHRSQISPRTATALLLIGFLAGAILQPIEDSNGQVSYQFAPSVPFSDSAKQRIAAEVSEQIATEWNQDGGSCVIRFANGYDFLEIVKSTLDLEEPEKAMAFAAANPCRIYFNAFDFPSPRVSLFISSLLHELGHAWGVEHSEDKESLFYKDALPGQTIKMADRFALWIAQQRQSKAST